MVKLMINTIDSSGAIMFPSYRDTLLFPVITSMGEVEIQEEIAKLLKTHPGRKLVSYTKTIIRGKDLETIETSCVGFVHSHNKIP